MRNDILATIDGALDDWETSPDAMRWSSEPVPERPIRGASGSRLVFDEARLLSPAVIVRAGVIMADFQRSMRLVAEAVARIDWPQLHRMLDAIDGYDEHHPKPLPIDGHAYARRRRNR